MKVPTSDTIIQIAYLHTETSQIYHTTFTATFILRLRLCQKNPENENKRTLQVGLFLKPFQSNKKSYCTQNYNGKL